MKPATGVTVEPAAWTALQKNSAVSSPSRATAMNAVSATAITPTSSAAPSEPESSWRMLRAVRRIQNDHPGDEADGDDRQRAAERLALLPVCSRSVDV